MNQGLLWCERKKKGDWTEKHRHVATKIFLERGWTQTNIIRYCRKAQAVPLSRMARSEARYSASFQEMGAKKAKTSEK